MYYFEIVLLIQKKVLYWTETIYFTTSNKLQSLGFVPY